MVLGCLYGFAGGSVFVSFMASFPVWLCSLSFSGISPCGGLKYCVCLPVTTPGLLSGLGFKLVGLGLLLVMWVAICSFSGSQVSIMFCKSWRLFCRFWFFYYVQQGMFSFLVVLTFLHS